MLPGRCRKFPPPQGAARLSSLPAHLPLQPLILLRPARGRRPAYTSSVNRRATRRVDCRFDRLRALIVFLKARRHSALVRIHSPRRRHATCSQECSVVAVQFDVFPPRRNAPVPQASMIGTGYNSVPFDCKSVPVIVRNTKWTRISRSRPEIQLRAANAISADYLKTSDRSGSSLRWETVNRVSSKSALVFAVFCVVGARDLVLRHDAYVPH
jgi:hypothetical protein